jgi:dipeptidyl aminopeptidase/acylaminoacyl peptidase
MPISNHVPNSSSGPALFLSALALSLLASCSGLSKRSDAAAGYSGHGASSVDEATLAKFAPPALPHETSRFVRSFLEVQSPGVGTMSPDGKTMFFTWAVTGTSQVWRLDNPMGFPVQMTSGSDSTSISDITPDGKYLILSRDRAGEENPGLYLQPVSGGPLFEIQHKPGVRTRHASVTNDGETIYYTANDIQPDSFALYSYSIPEKKKTLLFSEPGIWFVADMMGDHWFLLGKATGARSYEYYIWGTKERKLSPVIGQGEKEEYIVTFGRDLSEMLVLTNKFGEYKRLYVMRADGTFKPVTFEEKKDIQSFSIDHSRLMIALQWNDGGRTTLEFINARTYDPLKFPVYPEADHVSVGRISRFGRYVNFGVETGSRPRTNYVFDWKTQKATQWMKSGVPEIDETTFRAASLEYYPAADGTRIPMWVTRPAKCAVSPCPVVVHFHGGPEGQSRPGYSRLAQMMVGAGFVFVEPNVRGSEGYGRSWMAADNGAKRLDVVSDIEDCAKYIRSAWAKDGKAPKIGIMGWSYGGYSALMGMSRFAGSYDAGVAIVGMSNLRSFLLNTAPYRRMLRITEYGDPEKDREALEKLSPTTYLDRIRGPLMIIQGVSDPRVPAGEAIQMQRLLEKRGVKAPLILFGNEGHGARTRDNQVLELGHTLRFFQEHLGK